MGLQVSREEMANEWSLSFDDIDFVNAKPSGARLGVAAQLKYFAATACFATSAACVSLSSKAILVRCHWRACSRFASGWLSSRGWTCRTTCCGALASRD